VTCCQVARKHFAAIRKTEGAGLVRAFVLNSVRARRAGARRIAISLIKAH